MTENDEKMTVDKQAVKEAMLELQWQYAFHGLALEQCQRRLTEVANVLENLWTCGRIEHAQFALNDLLGLDDEQDADARYEALVAEFEASR